MRLLLSSITVCCFGFLNAQQIQNHFGAGQSDGITVTYSSQSNGSNAQATINGFGLDQHRYDASRFLGQSSLGANYELIEHVANIGPHNWIEEQFNAPMVNFKDTTQMIWDHFVVEYAEEWGADEVYGNPVIFPVSSYWRMAWWNNVMKSDDQLRQRVALALSEILVVSEKSQLELHAMGLADYYDKLYQNAFGNYRDLLEDVTLHPAMGFYLSHLNNEKSNEEMNIHPDENYAREVMQLFSIGLYELNQDGSVIVDGNNVPVPTYDNNDIDEFAKIFTGLGPAEYWYMWEDWSGIPVQWDNPANTIPSINMYLPMQMFEEWHEPGQKFLLNGQVVPSGQTGLEDISAALDNLFQHPNVGPFIGKQLIQRLVKSNPSPEYISRVAAAFNDNGEGVRGDMKAVIRAILLDDEARNCDWIELPSSGKMREPLIRYTQFMRAFDADNQSGKLWNWAYTFEAVCKQHVLAAPSVFNFFLPSHSPHGPIFDEGLVAPEFEILTSATAMNYINLIYAMLLTDNYMEVTTQASNTVLGFPEFDTFLLDPADRVDVELNDELLLADNAELLIERLDLILTGGTMSDESKNTIAETVTTVSLFDDETAVKTGILLTLICPDYVIQK
jgi:uncharacterized protein (DUF1800 family)